MINGWELLLIFVGGLVSLAIIGGIVALVVFLSRRGASAQKIDCRLQTLEKTVADLNEQKKE